MNADIKNELHKLIDNCDNELFYLKLKLCWNQARM